MLGGAEAVGYSVRVAARARTRRGAWRQLGRPWLFLAPALLVYSLFWVGSRSRLAEAGAASVHSTRRECPEAARSRPSQILSPTCFTPTF